ncbi:MAG: YeeE/YedE family protein [Pseudobdellovibrionaceae bacterium]
MDLTPIFYSLLGGALIGVAVTLMLLFNGRVTGISGILASSLSKPSKEGLWRWMFLAGMIVGGFLMHGLRPDFFVNLSDRGLAIVTAAGVLVGYGTVMGSGCTSGHGVCGISRFSVRSVLATVTFMVFGFLAVQAARYFLEG